MPRTSLVWPSNCGSASRTVTTAVSPSRTSSLVTASSLRLEQLHRAQLLVHRLDHGPLEAGDVGAALGRRDDVDERPHRGVVARAPAQRDVDAELALDLLGVMWPLSSSTGTVSLKCPEPCRRTTSWMPVSGAQELAELADPARVVERLLVRLSGPRWSRTTRVSPGTRNAVCRARAWMSARSSSASFRKIWRSGQNRTRVPVTPFFALPATRRPERSMKTASGSGPANSPATPRRKRHGVDLEVAVDLDVEPKRQRVDDRGADAVQPAGGRVRAAAELAAGVQLGHHELDAGEPGLRARRRPGCPGRRRGPRASRRRGAPHRSGGSGRPAPRRRRCR